MKDFIIKFGFALAFLMIPTISSAQQEVIMVRHANRPEPDTDPDPHLTDVGRCRAQALAKILKDAGVSAIVTSNTNRTRETAVPLAKLFSLPTKEIAVDENHVGAVYGEIKSRGDDAVVLYVGHSNTLEPLARRFNYQGQFSLGDDQYGNLFVLFLKGPNPTLIRLHYAPRFSEN
jgi:phosphohistidine phosphatase SixA